MCDYSLESVNRRDAVEGEDLIAHRFKTGTVGFISKDDPDCAVCCKSGVEMICHIDSEFSLSKFWQKPDTVILAGETPVVFHTQADSHSHRDGLLLPGGKILSLQDLSDGMRVTVTKALPKEIVEAAKGGLASKDDIEIRVQEIVAPVLVD